ncbi:hypothetical protein [Bhargavaea beijingensis]|uniref:Uncharacterized protein n=1 Tax=Bhargavaea beijingensis TaxID=426756 RepID=A0ABX9ZEA8_9BACL|nr:hypothetical protein [Bhargavaea beijingensis]MCW1928058.1 hypothetical protein [Bhargavaea beijingensis]RSK34284.1 hypothetical protein EJA12_04960 [Bhargavaea beijingensis]
MVRHSVGKPNLTGSQPGEEEAVLNMIDEGGPVHTARDEQGGDFNLRRGNGFGEEELRNITYQ